MTHLEPELLARKVGPRAVHQGIAAQVAALPYADAWDLQPGPMDSGFTCCHAGDLSNAQPS